MNYEEALNILEKRNVIYTDSKGGDAIRTAVKAVEKQIPKKPVKGKCPICGNNVQFWSCGDVKSDYCDRCGQSIDWMCE